MKPYFAGWSRVEMLRLAAESWIGTPFIPFAAVRGAGVDCVNLCAELLKASGFQPPSANTWPRYAMDGGKHNRESQLIAWLHANKQFAPVWNRTLWTLGTPAYDASIAMPGDVLCFTIGRSAHHAGLLIGGTKFIHCLFARKVMFASLADATFKRRLTAVYRPLEEAR